MSFKNIIFIIILKSLAILPINSQHLSDSIQAHFHHEQASLAVRSNLDSTITHLQKAQIYFSKINDYEYIIDCYNGLFYCHERLENVHLLKHLAQKTYAYANEKLDSLNPARFDATINIGVFYYKMSDLISALKYYREAESLYEYGADIHINSLFNLYNNLAAVYRKLGDIQRAIDHYQRALSLIEDHTSIRINEINQTKQNLAKALNASGNNVRAKEIWDEIANLPDHTGSYTWIIESLISLTKMAISENRIDSANLYLDKLQVHQRYHDNYKIDQTHRLLSSIHNIQGDEIKSLHFSEKYVVESEKRYDLIKQDYRLTEAYLYHANILASRNKEIESKKYFHMAMQATVKNRLDSNNILTAHIDSIVSPLTAINIIKDYSRYLSSPEIENNYLTDTVTIRSMIEFVSLLIDKIIGSVSREQSKLLHSKDLRYQIEYFINYLFEWNKKTGNDEYLKMAMALSLKNKNRLLHEEIIGYNTLNTSNNRLSLFKIESKLKQEISYLQRKLSKIKNSDAKIKIQEQVFELREKIASIEENISQAFPDYYKFRFLSDSQINSFLKTIQADDRMYINIYSGPKSIFLFSWYTGHMSSTQIPYTDDLEGRLMRFNMKLQNPRSMDVNTYCNLAHSIYKDIFGPIWQNAPTGTEIVISNDGLLNRIPIEVLTQTPYAEDIHSFLEVDYLIKNYSVSYINALSPQEHMTPNDIRMGGFAPDYRPNMDSLQLSALPHNVDELEGIKKYFPGDIFSGTRADLTSFKQNASEYGVLHLAAHAVTDDLYPGNSRLYFSNNQLNYNDVNALYPHDLYELNLNAEMVVLSACETGKGKYAEGEGVFSLARHFLASGARSVVNSLWKADDAATADIMESYYKHLSKGQSKSKALAMAKRSFMDEADVITSHPYYWSSFVILGNTRPLVDRHFSKWLWFVGALIGTLAFGLILIKRKSSSP